MSSEGQDVPQTFIQKMAQQLPSQSAESIVKALVQHQEDRFAKFSGEPEAIQSLKDDIRRTEPIPSVEQLRTILDAAFFSSLTQEEGSPVAFSLCIADPNVGIESKWPRIQLTEPLPLTTEHIRKLSPAAPPGLVDIAVFPNGDEVKIWGLLYLRLESPGHRSYPPGMTVLVPEPGVLSVRFSGSELLSYSRGEATVFGVGEDIDEINLAAMLARVFADTEPFPGRFRTAMSLLRMGAVALHNGFGATLLVVPADHTLVGIDPPRYEADSHSQIALLEALLSPTLSAVAGSVARLLAVDGAVMFVEGNGLRGAGAMIHTADTGNFAVRILRPQDPEKSPIDTSLHKFNGGARHRSALVFCYRNPGVFAIVVSQDRVMSLIVRPLHEEVVYAFRPIRSASLRR